MLFHPKKFPFEEQKLFTTALLKTVKVAQIVSICSLLKYVVCVHVYSSRTLCVATCNLSLFLLSCAANLFFFNELSEEEKHKQLKI